MSILSDMQRGAADLVAWRRDFHCHPEPGRQERRTAARVAELLRSWDIETHTGVGGHGVVGLIRGRAGPGRVVALRADMDALPVAEENRHDHVSQQPGVMHACGHDAHMAMLLGAARRLAAERDFPGTVTLIFQPAEEGQGGAEAMIADGLFDRFPCDEIYGLHNQPRSPSGVFLCLPEAVMSGADFFEIDISGRGAHASAPHQSADPVYAGALLTQALQQIVSRNADPRDTTVVSVTRFSAGEACNVIPDRALLAGSTRFFRPEQGVWVWRRLEEICRAVGAACGLAISCRLVSRALVLLNSPGAAAAMAEAATAVVGPERVLLSGEPEMASEDFSFFRESRPGGFILLGNQPAGHEHTLHSPRFGVDESILPLGAAYWVELARRRLTAARGLA